MHEKEINTWELAFEDYEKGMKYKDIAEKYGVTLNTVKSWKTRKWNEEGVHTKSKKVCTQKKHAEEVVTGLAENEEITEEQQLFCLYYSKTFNATSAYKKAYNCSYDTANAHGYKLLLNVVIKDEIMRLKKERMSKTFLTEEDLFQRYMDIAFADITDFVEFGYEVVDFTDDTGKERVAKVSYVAIKNHDEIDGTIINEVSKGKDGVKVKLADRMKALEWLTKHTNMATEEQKAKLELLKAQTLKITGDEGGEIEDDGFLEALGNSAAEDWTDED